MKVSIFALAMVHEDRLELPCDYGTREEEGVDGKFDREEQW